MTAPDELQASRNTTSTANDATSGSMRQISAPSSEQARVPEPDPSRHLSLDELEERGGSRAPSPRDAGAVTLICSRLSTGRRWLAPRIAVDPVGGLSGDRWYDGRVAGEQKYGDLYADMQVATIEASVAELIANGQPLPLFGDNLFLDLDLSSENLPTGSEIEIGAVLLRVTPAPHNGCNKFHARFGASALRYVADPSSRSKNRRGIYLRVVEGGEIGVGDTARVRSRTPAAI